MTSQWIDRAEGGGPLALRLMRSVAFICGRGTARLLLWPITGYFLLRRAPERHASRAYLTRVLGRPARLRDVARHFHCFAATILDRAFLLSERLERFDIRCHGLEALHRIMEGGRGVLLLGTHLGSFDALRVLALERPDAIVRPVVDVGHSPVISRLFERLNPGLAATIINARQPGTAVALAIREALAGGALVTLLADRARPGQGVVAVPFLGEDAEFPTSPWLLAATLKVPVVLCCGLYGGANRYDLHFETLAETLVIDRRERAAALRTIVARFATRLEHYTRMAPCNWFNFYDFWQGTPVARGGGEPDAHIARGGARSD
jgi:predicted LPLAT superfamily acyltransferase